MQRNLFLIVSYVLVFSLLGIGILQYLFINKQKELVEKQILYSVSNAMNEIEWELKKEELKKIISQLDTLKIIPNFKHKPSHHASLIDSLPNQSGVLSLLDTKSGYFQSGIFNNTENDIINKALVELSYLYLNQNFDTQPINKRFNPEIVQKIIKKVFKQKKIDFPFEFAVYHQGFETSVKSENFKNDPRKFLLIETPILNDNPEENEEYKLIIAIKKKNIFNNNILLFQILSYLFTAFLIISFLITIFNMMRQRHLNELKNDFINNITHEFKTPIATMNLAIDAIKSPAILNDPEKVKHYLKILKTENARMLDQVEKILFLAKLEQGKVIWNNQPVNIHEIIHEVLEHMKLIFQSKNATVRVDLKARKPYIYGDPVFIFDMLINLLDNAVKYSTDIIDISISTENKNAYLIIKISDKGVGMSKEVYENIFDKFYRKPTGDVHNIKGHGIGLTFVKQVVKKLKGDIKVKSEVGKGTTFTIEIPIMKEKNLKQNNHKNQIS